MEDTVDRLYRNAVCLAPMVRVVSSLELNQENNH